MNKEKIVIIVPSLTIGGAESMVYQLASELRKKELSLTVICIASKKNTYYEKELEKNNVNIIYLNNNSKSDFKTLMKIYIILNKIRPNIIHTHLHTCIYAIPWALTHRVKFFHTIHSEPKFEFSKRIRKIMKLMYKCNIIIPIAISDIIKEKMKLEYKIPLNKIKTIYNPVDVDKFYLESKVSKDFIRFVSVGRLNENKNQKMLIEAFYEVQKEFPNIKLTLIGDGILREKLEYQVKKNKIDDKVEFYGNIDYVEKILNKSDIFVLTSIYEGLPISIIEAMACGLPIISTNVGGIKDIIDKNGILINDLRELINSMKKLILDESLRISMGNKSLDEAKKYNKINIAEKYINLYNGES
ncbi:glycosyltransferase [Clostridium perfringens]